MKTTLLFLKHPMFWKHRMFFQMGFTFALNENHAFISQTSDFLETSDVFFQMDSIYEAKVHLAAYYSSIRCFGNIGCFISDGLHLRGESSSCCLLLKHPMFWKHRMFFFRWDSLSLFGTACLKRGVSCLLNSLDKCESSDELLGRTKILL